MLQNISPHPVVSPTRFFIEGQNSILPFETK